MKALSVHPYYAMMIASGQKTIEVRSWETNYRGDILICSTAKKLQGLIPSHALGVVTLKDVVPLKRCHCDAAMMTQAEYTEYGEGLFAWILENPRYIEPFYVKGRLSLWNCDHEINFLPVAKTDKEDDELFDKYWKDLLV